MRIASAQVPASPVPFSTTLLFSKLLRLDPSVMDRTYGVFAAVICGVGGTHQRHCGRSPATMPPPAHAALSRIRPSPPPCALAATARIDVEPGRSTRRPGPSSTPERNDTHGRPGAQQTKRDGLLRSDVESMPPSR